MRVTVGGMADRLDFQGREKDLESRLVAIRGPGLLLRLPQEGRRGRCGFETARVRDRSATV